MITRLTLPGLREVLDVAHIEKSLEAVPGVQRVTLDREKETAEVEHEGADLEALKAAARAVGLSATTVSGMTDAGAAPASGRTSIILAPVDFSATTEHVVSAAAKLARALRGRVVLTHVTEPTAGVVDYAAIVVAVAQVNEAAVNFAVKRLGELERQLQADGVDASSLHLTGTPVSELVEQARSLPADYIVIGSHGHTAFYDLLVGGTTHGILKRVACPVVVVPPAAKQKSGDSPRD